MNNYEIDLLRDTAILLEDTNIEAAYHLMKTAHKHRSNGPMINKKIASYKQQLQVDNGLLNIHLGAHKTATTYLQEHLASITDPSFYYADLQALRKAIKHTGFFNFISTFDWNKSTVISDENLIGKNNTILTGQLYPYFMEYTDKYLSPFKNRDLINIFITIRPMTEFIPSQYCEYLRKNSYMHYQDFVSHIHVPTHSWHRVLHKTVTANPDISFKLFDFTKFAECKDSLIKELSFNNLPTCNKTILPSRPSFTYQEISILSKGTVNFDSTEKFSPHTDEEKQLSLETYQKDIQALAQYPNINFITS